MRSPLRTLAAAVGPDRAKAPVPYVGRASSGMAATAGAAGQEQQMRAMGSVGTLFSITNQNSTALAGVVWHLYRKAKSGLKEDRVEVTEHPAIDLWQKPNPFYTGKRLRESGQQHIDLTGEGPIVVVRHPRWRIPMELWPVRPDRLHPVPDAEKFLAGYEYWSPDGQTIKLGTSDVMRILQPHPLDPYRGLGAVQTILTDLDSSRMSAEWNRMFFQNSATPGGVIEAPTALSDPEFDEFQARWAEAHRGVSNAHRVAILEAGMKWVDRSFSPRDMQFTELRDASERIILRAFAMPKFGVGDVDDVNRATAEASSVWIAEHLTVPRADRWKEMLNAELLPMYGPLGEGLEWDYDSPVKEDRQADNDELLAKAEAYQRFIDAGVDPEDAADACKLPRMRVTITRPAPAPVPAVPAPAAPELEAPATAARLNGRRIGSDGAGVDLFAVAGLRPWPGLTAAADPPDRLGPDELPDITPVRDSYVAALADLLTKWAKILADQIRNLVEQIRGLVRGGQTSDLPNVTAPTGDAVQTLTGALEELAGDAARQVVQEAAQQGVTIDPGTVDRAILRETAVVNAALLGNTLADSAAQEAARVAVPGQSGDKEADRVADLVQQHLEGLSDAGPRDRLGAALHTAQHTGRAATFTQAEQDTTLPQVNYYAHEIADANRCEPCSEIDGRYLGATFTEALHDYPGTGYVNCDGRQRCRGEVVAIWRGSGVDQEVRLGRQTATP